MQRMATVAEAAYDTDSVHAAVAVELLVALRADQVHVLATEPDREGTLRCLVFLPGRPAAAYRLEAGAVPPGVEWVAATGLPLVVPWSRAGATLPGVLTDDWHVASALIVPVPGDGRARAVALTASHAERAFDEYEVQVAQTLAAQAAAALAMVEARAAASHDALTGCLNQGAMLRRLGEELARARREGGALGVLLIDLDDFKAINDRHGHLVGDGVLRQVGETLRQEFRSNDCVARWGGDEFVVILSGTHGPRAEIAARRALHRIHEINVLSNGRHEAVSASIGMSSSDDPTSADELLANADTALREAKRSGKDRLGFAAAHGPSGAR